MAKVTIGGEVFEFDLARLPMEEALALEDALKIPYAQYQQGLQEGRARSLAGFVWLVWRRNGKDVPLEDILSGTVGVDLNALEIDTGEEEDGGGTGPTTPPTPPALSSTGAGTSARSRKSSASARGRPGS